MAPASAGKRARPKSATPFPFKLLDQRIAERIRGAGIKTCKQWRDLTPFQRDAIWGITRAVRIEVDAIVTAALERKQT